MMVVEASHAHVMRFCRLTVNCQFLLYCQCHFLGEKCDDENSIYFFLN
jgi:hypothetical protein